MAEENVRIADDVPALQARVLPLCAGKKILRTRLIDVLVQPANVAAHLKQRAQSEGVSLDEAATEAVRVGLEAGRWRRLLSVGRKYGKDSGYTQDDIEGVIQSFRNETRGR